MPSCWLSFPHLAKPMPTGSDVTFLWWNKILYVVKGCKSGQKYLTRGSQTNILIRPKARSNHSKLSFLGTAADIWNQLPPGIRQIPDYIPFVKACQVLFSS